jgi:hypothetical protein
VIALLAGGAGVTMLLIAICGVAVAASAALADRWAYPSLGHRLFWVLCGATLAAGGLTMAYAFAQIGGYA